MHHAKSFPLKYSLGIILIDDYDRLIQLCDRLSIGVNYNLKERMKYLQNTYKIPTVLLKKKYREALKLKSYFDAKCGCDIYKLLGVN